MTNDELFDRMNRELIRLRSRLAEAERLLREVRSKVRLADMMRLGLDDPIATFLADQPSDVCAECGEELEEVRPGKYQHVGECKADKGTAP